MPNKRTFVFHDFDMSYEEIKKGWKMPYAHLHSHYEIYILLSGERIVTIGDNTYHVSAGDATLFAQETLHQSEGDTDFSGICIHFSVGFLNRYLKASTVKNLMQCFEYPVIALPDTYLRELYEMTAHFDWKEHDNYLKLSCILSRLNQYQSASSKTPLIPSSRVDLSRKILQYLDTHYAVINTIEEISNNLDISPSYIYRCVKAQTQMTPKEYINHLRIRNAMRDLEYGNKNLSVIQELCGFHSASYFLRVFKRETGMTPTQYRRQHQKA